MSAFADVRQRGSFVGGYTLHLYCDERENTRRHRANHHLYGVFADFFAETRAGAVTLARRAGWRVNGRRVLCPRCANGAATP